ncbi:MAG: hypothetical protein FWH26_05115 [Oscillospiraceae bacterium]|nr:hypothetical protein [Oscillospiraceae bacterium]
MNNEITLRGYDIFVEAHLAGLVESILGRHGFDALTDGEGNIVGVDFYDDDMREDEELYVALIPFLREGSYMEFCDELGNLWRWVFSGGDCHRITPIELWRHPNAPPSPGLDVMDELDRYLLAA